MTNKEFIARAQEALSCRTLYVMGGYGAQLTSNNKTKYTKNHSYNMKEERVKMIYTASNDTFAFDCSGLIKGILWGWNKLTPAKYASNGVPDTNADTIYNRYLLNKSTDFKNIVPGEAVWMKGHIGIYIGDGQVIESSPRWENGVQLTYLADMGYTGNCRKWTGHGKLPWIEYENVIVETSTQPQTNAIGTRTYKVVKGDTLSKIAARYGTSIDKIVSDNIKKYPKITRNFIITGWVLNV